MPLCHRLSRARPALEFEPCVSANNPLRQREVQSEPRLPTPKSHDLALAPRKATSRSSTRLTPHSRRWEWTGRTLPGIPSPRCVESFTSCLRAPLRRAPLVYWPKPTMTAHTDRTRRPVRDGRGLRHPVANASDARRAAARPAGRMDRGARRRRDVEPVRRRRTPDPRGANRLGAAREDHPRARRGAGFRQVRPAGAIQSVWRSDTWPACSTSSRRCGERTSASWRRCA